MKNSLPVSGDFPQNFFFFNGMGRQWACWVFNRIFCCKELWRRGKKKTQSQTKLAFFKCSFNFRTTVSFIDFLPLKRQQCPSAQNPIQRWNYELKLCYTCTVETSSVCALGLPDDTLKQPGVCARGAAKGADTRLMKIIHHFKSEVLYSCRLLLWTISFDLILKQAVFNTQAWPQAQWGRWNRNRSFHACICRNSRISSEVYLCEPSLTGSTSLSCASISVLISFNLRKNSHRG